MVWSGPRRRPSFKSKANLLGVPIAVAQIVQTIGIAAAGSVTSPSITVSAGSIVVVVGASVFGTTNTLSWADTGGGGPTWNIIDTLTPGFGIRQIGYSIRASAGTFTVDGTYGSANHVDRGIALIEVTGADTGSPIDQHLAASQGSGTGTDAITTGNPSATTNAVCLILGATVNGNLNQTAATGTGFTTGGASPYAWDGNSLAVESKRVTSTGVYPATFTPSASSSWDTFVVAIKEAAAGGLAWIRA